MIFLVLAHLLNIAQHQAFHCIRKVRDKSIPIQIDYPGSGNKSEFVYDGRGRRVGITETNAGTPDPIKQYIFSGRVRCEERQTGSNGYLYRFGETKGSATSYYSKDQVDSVRELTDQTGAVTGEYGYSNFGIATKLSGSADSSYQFAGLFVHARSKLLLSDSRPYSAILARWLSRDDSEANGLNLFVYADNLPTLLVDPVGMSASTSGGGHASSVDPSNESDEEDLPNNNHEKPDDPDPDPKKNKEKKCSSNPNKKEEGNPCPPAELDKVNYAARKFWNEIKNLLEDVNELYPVSPNPRPGKEGTWPSHIRKAEQKRTALRRAINRARALGCLIPRSAEELLKYKLPDKPLKYQ